MISVLASSFQLLALNCFAQADNYVRVAITPFSKYFNLKINGDYEVTNSNTNEIIGKARNIDTTVTSSKEGIILGENNYLSNRILVSVKNEDGIIINGRRFRGKIQFIQSDREEISLINFVDLEDYIKGILYHEASHYWPMEVLKAQAIASRTFVVYQMIQNKLQDFDVTSDIYSQVYGGRTSERYRTNLAVKQTQQKVLTFNGNIFPTFFHATCAGHTEDASLLWSIDIAPLKGVKCGFCNESKHFNWHYVLALDSLKEKLLKSGFTIDSINDIEILGRDRSKRITGLNIVGVQKEVKISTKDFRNIIGPNIIRSTNFQIKLFGNQAIFEGLGWGHGVGLCQWGAYFMAKQGYKSGEILEYYYPGSKVTTIEDETF